MLTTSIHQQNSAPQAPPPSIEDATLQSTADGVPVPQAVDVAALYIHIAIAKRVGSTQGYWDCTRAYRNALRLRVLDLIDTTGSAKGGQ